MPSEKTTRRHEQRRQAYERDLRGRLGNNYICNVSHVRVDDAREYGHRAEDMPCILVVLSSTGSESAVRRSGISMQVDQLPVYITHRR